MKGRLASHLSCAFFLHPSLSGSPLKAIAPSLHRPIAPSPPRPIALSPYRSLAPSLSRVCLPQRRTRSNAIRLPQLLTPDLPPTPHRKVNTMSADHLHATSRSESPAPSLPSPAVDGLAMPRGRQSTAQPSVTVFCGSRHGLDTRFAQEAGAFGVWIATQGWRLVYGGGNVGLMGELARAALGAGGEVLGIIPESLMRREVGLEGISRLEVVSDMAIRKQRLIDEGDLFVILPGGLGTLDEFFEVATLLQLGYHHKPIVLFNQTGFWDPLLGMLQTLVHEGFVAQREYDAWHVAQDLAALKTRCVQLLGASAQA